MFTGKSLITKPLPGAMINRTHPRARGLVGYWILNEGAGIRANDISGYGNFGELNNFALFGNTSNWMGSPLGGCLHFDGTNDRIFLGTPPSLDLFGELTISAWVNTNTIAVGSRSILSSTNAAGSLCQIGFNINGSTGGILDINWLTVTIVSSTTALLADTWYHVVAVRSGSTGVWRGTIYINGKQDASAAVAANPSVQQVYSIGRRGGNAARFWSGFMDEVRVYSRALSAMEIGSLYSQPHADLMYQSFAFNPVVANMSRFFLAS